MSYSIYKVTHLESTEAQSHGYRAAMVPIRRLTHLQAQNGRNI